MQLGRMTGGPPFREETQAQGRGHRIIGRAQGEQGRRISRDRIIRVRSGVDRGEEVGPAGLIVRERDIDSHHAAGGEAQHADTVRCNAPLRGGPAHQPHGLLAIGQHLGPD